MTFVLRGPSTLTPIAERLVVELPLPVFFSLRSVVSGIRTPKLPLRINTLTHWATAAINVSEKVLKLILIHIDF